jgi:DNA-binding CsgD family transcriptional regulator
MVRGLQDKELAVELGIAPRTVKFHAANLLRKLGGGRRLDLFRLLLTVPLEGGDEPEASKD